MKFGAIILSERFQWLLSAISVSAMLLAALHSRYGFLLWAISGAFWMHVWTHKGLKARWWLELACTGQSLLGFIWWWWHGF